MNDTDTRQVLRELRFLEELDDADLASIAAVSRMETFAAGEVVFREGELAREIFLVHEGNVALEICAPSIGCKRVMTAGAGDLLGWSPILDQASLTATRTLQPTSLVAIDAEQLLAFCTQHPRVGYDFMRCVAQAIARRLKATRMQLLDVYGAELPHATVQQPPTVRQEND